MWLIGTVVVDETDANIEYGETIEVNEIHQNVTKPMSPSDPLYTKLIAFIFDSILNSRH